MSEILIHQPDTNSNYDDELSAEDWDRFEQWRKNASRQQSAQSSSRAEAAAEPAGAGSANFDRRFLPGRMRGDDNDRRPQRYDADANAAKSEPAVETPAAEQPIAPAGRILDPEAVLRLQDEAERRTKSITGPLPEHPAIHGDTSVLKARIKAEVADEYLAGFNQEPASEAVRYGLMTGLSMSREKLGTLATTGISKNEQPAGTLSPQPAEMDITPYIAGRLVGQRSIERLRAAGTDGTKQPAEEDITPYVGRQRVGQRSIERIRAAGTDTHNAAQAELPPRVEVPTLMAQQQNQSNDQPMPAPAAPELESNESQATATDMAEAEAEGAARSQVRAYAEKLVHDAEALQQRRVDSRLALAELLAEAGIDKNSPAVQLAGQRYQQTYGEYDAQLPSSQRAGEEAAELARLNDAVAEARQQRTIDSARAELVKLVADGVDPDDPRRGSAGQHYLDTVLATAAGKGPQARGRALSREQAKFDRDLIDERIARVEALERPKKPAGGGQHSQPPATNRPKAPETGRPGNSDLQATMREWAISEDGLDEIVDRGENPDQQLVETNWRLTRELLAGHPAFADLDEKAATHRLDEIEDGLKRQARDSLMVEASLKLAAARSAMDHVNYRRNKAAYETAVTGYRTAEDQFEDTMQQLLDHDPSLQGNDKAQAGKFKKQQRLAAVGLYEQHRRQVPASPDQDATAPIHLPKQKAWRLRQRWNDSRVKRYIDTERAR